MDQTEDQAVLDRLDKIAFLLNLAFREQIDAAQRQVLADPISASLLEVAAEQWVGAGELKRQVAAATGQSERTVSRRLSQLVSQGWITSAGGGANIKYRASGV